MFSSDKRFFCQSVGRLSKWYSICYYLRKQKLLIRSPDLYAVQCLLANTLRNFSVKIFSGVVQSLAPILLSMVIQRVNHQNYVPFDLNVESTVLHKYCKHQFILDAMPEYIGLKSGVESPLAPPVPPLNSSYIQIVNPIMENELKMKCELCSTVRIK